VVGDLQGVAVGQAVVGLLLGYLDPEAFCAEEEGEG
jgi:hypothetical protein